MFESGLINASQHPHVYPRPHLPTPYLINFQIIIMFDAADDLSWNMIKSLCLFYRVSSLIRALSLLAFWVFWQMKYIFIWLHMDWLLMTSVAKSAIFHSCPLYAICMIRSFGLDLENGVRSVAPTVLDGFFPYLVQMITSIALKTLVYHSNYD